MVNYLKTMVLGCFWACALVGQEVMLSPLETILAGETTTLWGVLAGSRWQKGRFVRMCGSTIVGWE